MSLQSLLQIISTDPNFQLLKKGWSDNKRDQMVIGLTGPAKHLYVAALRDALQRPFLLVTSTMQQAQQAYDDFVELLPQEEVYLFGERETSLLDVMAYSPEQAAQRLGVLQALIEGKAGVVIAPVSALRQTLLPREVFAAAALSLKVGQEIQLERLVAHLIYLGYERVDRVESKGEFAVRGGIVDLFPLTREEAVRLELFDVEIDSLRTFDPDTQRSSGKLQELTLWPIREVIASRERIVACGEAVAEKLKQKMAKVKDETLKERLQQYVGSDVEKLLEGVNFPGLIRYAHMLYPSDPTLLDYLPADTLYVFDEPGRLREEIRHLEREDGERETAALEHGEILPGLLPKVDLEPILRDHSRDRLFLSLFMRHYPGLTLHNIVNIPSKAMQNFHGQMNVLKAELERWQHAGYRVLFLAASRERAERLKRVLDDYAMQVEIVENIQSVGARPVIFLGNLTGGCELSSLKWVLITEAEVFTAQRRRMRRMKEISDVQKIKSYQDLRVGDYVVHVNHGIGKYMGIETLEIDGIHKDYLNIKYAGNDKLYVPVDQIDQVQKYIGGEDKEPKLYSLGGSEWMRVKNRVAHSVKDIAEELIKLYAKRQATPGYAFSPDTQWQRDFEAMFPYEETPDQLRAIAEIKADMEKPRPMDRLLCGDVGYGKTEVAIRAAFKAVMDGKQVAVLVPTTILAQQHYETFKERCAGFPVKIEVVSRFRSRGEMREVLKGLREGTVDIVIGTHRLLQKGVTFKDLGLLIVDEEQRFGVTHKEKIKQLKTNVDCLTMTATPIPRTLHMSMLGIRDLSVIETPPENRFPVQTFVVEYSPSLVREAIERELGRNGQVYFLFNRVREIEQMAERVRMLVPDARVAVAHGQMGEEELERVMLEFLEGEKDVLVSTTIIETGIDIPNVNTLIVYDADRMGLSQLYQLRGRVGRSNRIAYAYFTYQRDKVLSEVAEKRLQAIKEFTELGSGFKIAMRDLAIRGAGNLLGAEQHGFIASVGFDLYSEMLAEAIRDLKGEKVEEVIEPTVELAVDAYIPQHFITDGMQKIEIYKKFVAAKTLQDVYDLEEEIEDRFGDLPQEVRNLLAVTRIKAYARQYDFISVTQHGHDVVLKLAERQNNRIQGEKLFALNQQFPNRMHLTAGQNITITLRVKGLKGVEILSLLEKFMQAYKVVPKEEVISHA